jgi:hypothetical protein
MRHRFAGSFRPAIKQRADATKPAEAGCMRSRIAFSPGNVAPSSWTNGERGLMELRLPK